ncbi:restriction endonuclease subunit S [Neobacillus drentensis]|uniref:restriction endonuclease subunit S n=1 Tax=Neobacillus drentensis TaxID=220684 RepID=UPI0030012A04
MVLSKLGTFLELLDLKNSDGEYGTSSVVGISTNKQFIPTKADLSGVRLNSYKLVPPNCFSYVSDTSRRGDKISIAYNTSKDMFLVSTISLVFRVIRPEELLPDYLFLYFNRPEFDRYTRFNSWGSAREYFLWEDMCDIEIDLPPLPIQKKYVDLYNAMVQNQKVFESGLEDLKLTCDAYIDELRRNLPPKAIGEYIEQLDERNKSLCIDAQGVRGISTGKEFIPTKADLKGVSLGSYKVVRVGSFAYVSDTSRRGDKISLAFNHSDDHYLVSSISTVFRVVKTDELLPEYLMMHFSRSEFNRYVRFNSWGSARETFVWDDMCEVKIPVPDIEVQRSIVNIYNAYIKRRDINEKLKAKIKDICPILIKGSLEEAKLSLKAGAGHGIKLYKGSI